MISANFVGASKQFRFLLSNQKWHEHADSCKEAFRYNIRTPADRLSNHAALMNSKLKDFAADWELLAIFVEVYTLYENACVLLASYRRWSHKELMWFTSSLIVIKFHLKNRKKILVLNDPFQRPVNGKCGEKNCGDCPSREEETRCLTSLPTRVIF